MKPKSKPRKVEGYRLPLELIQRIAAVAEKKVWTNRIVVENLRSAAPPGTFWSNGKYFHAPVLLGNLHVLT